MELAIMVSQLKNEAEVVMNEIKEKKAKQKSLQLQIAALDQEIQKISGKYDAINNAIDQLGGVCSECAPVGGIHAIRKPEKPKGHSRKPRRIGKFDANGVKIGEYPSICQAAKVFGWGTVPLTRYIEGESREKQIKLRGFYLEFIKPE